MHRMVSIGSAGKGRNSIRLRWRFNHQRYSFCMTHTLENIARSRMVALRIEADIRNGEFDETLEKYRDQKKITLNYPDRFEYWCTHLRNVDMNQSHDYLGTQKMMRKWGAFDLDEVPELFSREKLSATTYNRRLMYLHSFFTWMVKKKYITENPFEGIKRRKKSNLIAMTVSRRKPLTIDQIQSILTAIHDNTYMHPSSAYPQSHYYPFLMFMFSTGVRTSEAIGLRVKNVFADYVRISEALARTVKGANAAARIRKTTKTGEIRNIPLSPELKEMLKTACQGKQPDDLVFLSPRGKAIDDRMLQRRVLKPVLAALGISPRDLYVSRHSFGSLAIEQGMPPTQVAYLMGHRTVETTFRNYVNVVNLPKSLPEIL